MTVENTTTIDGLDAALPNIVDGLNETDNHIRQLKSVDKFIFQGSGLNGFSEAIVAREIDLNFLQGLTGNIEAQLVNARKGQVPIGGIQFYQGLLSAIPARFFLCNGANGTPNLIDMFLLGEIVESQLNGVGGSADDVVVSHTHSINHNHTASTTDDGGHSHIIDQRGSAGGPAQLVGNPNGSPSTTRKTELGGSHPHIATMPSESVNAAQAGVSPLNTNLPQYYKAAYIMRVT